MIVRCERCETRFKLDESRLPASGARVRCSRCKHAFFVVPPGATRENLVHQVAADAAAERTRPPEPSWDLDESAGATRISARRKGGEALASEAGSPGEAEDDSDWQFEDEVPNFDATGSGLDLPLASAGGGAAERDPNETSFAEIGDPESWDLLSTAPAEPAPSAPLAPAAAAPAQPLPAPRTEPEAAVPLRDALAPPARVSPAPAAAAAAAARLPEARPSPRVAWVGVVLGIALAAWGGFRGPRASEPGVLGSVAGFEVVDARARRIENALAGELLVVSGRLRNPGSEERAVGGRMQVLLHADDGSVLTGVTAVAGPALPAARVREEDPRALREAQERAAGELAGRAVAPGATVDFDAVFEAAPAAAARFSLAPLPN